jgi:hypothetical protein
MDATRALTEFDRWFAVQDLTHDQREYDRARFFFDWLPRYYADPDDRATITAAYDAREAEREAAQAQAAAKAAEAERQRVATFIEYADPPLTADELPAFVAWLAQGRNDDGKYPLVTAAGDYLHFDEGVSFWRSARAEAAAKAAAKAEAERHAREAQEEQRLAAQYARDRADAERRAALIERLADPAWVRGEDPASLRAVMAWRRTRHAVTFRVTNGPARDALAAADRELVAAIAERATAIAAAQRQEQAEPPRLRRARGLDPVEVPNPLDVAALADPDDVARWLVAHAGAYTLAVGYWNDEDIFDRDDDDDKVVGTRRTLYQALDDAITTRCARWAVYARIEALAAANPDAAPVLRVQALRVLTMVLATRYGYLESTPYEDGDAPLLADLKAEQQRWRFEPVDEPDESDPIPSAAELAADPAAMQSPAVVLPYVAWARRFTVLAAREKDGKSTLLGSAAAAFTRGAPWLGEPTSGGTVLWLHEEAERDVVARLQQFGADLDRVFPVRLPLAAERHLATVAAEVGPGLIVIDSLIRYAGDAITDPASSAQWERVLTPLRALAHAAGGPAIVALHHAGKKDGEYRDSTHIGAACDMLVQMPAGLRGSRQTLEAVGSIVGVPPFTITVELVGDAHRLVGGDGAAGMLPKSQGVALAALRGLVPTPTSEAVASPEWERAAGLKHATFVRARDALVEARLVERLDGDRFRPRA